MRRPAKSAAKTHKRELTPKAFEGDRIAKVMARAGICSRRDAEQWIVDGRVAVNGTTLTSPAFNVAENDKILIDGEPMVERERTRLFLFHKPAGLVTSAKDPEGRETVFDRLKARYPDLPRVVSVGRLDINTEGLLLLTNDGGLARTLELPATGWTRRYRVRAHGDVDQAKLDTLAKGVTVEGVAYAPIEARLDRVQGANAWLTMSLSEGKNREIKRVLQHLVLDVTRLIRISFGPFQLGDLPENGLEEVRLKVLRDQLGKGLAELAGVDFSSSVREEPTAAEAQETRRREQNRPRKHVSALRKPRETEGEQKPRARVERAVTADRQGRAVAVERIVVKGDKPVVHSRNARRFEALREQLDPPAERRAPRLRGEEETRNARGDGAKRFDRNQRSEEPRQQSGSNRARPRLRADEEARPARSPRGDFGQKREFEARGSRSGETRPRAARYDEPRQESGASRERPRARPDKEARPARSPRGDFGQKRGFEARGSRSGETRPRAARYDEPRQESGSSRERPRARPDKEARPARSPRERTSGPAEERTAFQGRRPPRRENERITPPGAWGKPRGEGKSRGPGGSHGGKPPPRGPKRPR